MDRRVVLCRDGGCCPAVEFTSDEVRIGEGDNIVVLSFEEWNILVEKVRSGELVDI